MQISAPPAPMPNAPSTPAPTGRAEQGGTASFEQLYRPEGEASQQVDSKQVDAAEGQDNPAAEGADPAAHPLSEDELLALINQWLAQRQANSPAGQELALSQGQLSRLLGDNALGLERGGQLQAMVNSLRHGQSAQLQQAQQASQWQMGTAHPATLAGQDEGSLMAQLQQFISQKTQSGEPVSLERLSSAFAAATAAMQNTASASVLPTAVGATPVAHHSLSTANASAEVASSVQQFQASVDISEPEWGRDLVEQLRSRMKLSKGSHLQQAHIRLDPPELGRLEVNIRLDGDKASVHFSAAHPQLREALASNADRLRMDLDGSQLQLVDVSVSSGMQQHQQQQGHADEQHVVAAQQITPAQHSVPTYALASSRYESVV